MGKEIEASETDRSVFISGIPYTSSEEEVKAIFVDCGTIQCIKLPKFQDSGRLLGYGHIVFTSSKSIAKALLKDKTYIGSRYISVQKATGEKQHTPQSQAPPAECKTVFVKNLPFTITSEEIGNVFRHCGVIENVRMVFNTVNQNFKGFCYIDFKLPSSVNAALKMSGKDVSGRRIIVDFETGQARKGFHYGKQQLEDDKFVKDVKEIQHKKIKKEKQKNKVEAIKNYGRTRKEELAELNRKQRETL